MFVQDLLKKSEDDKVKDDLSLGIAAAERTLQKANEAVDRDLLDDALEDLKTRVDDWKNHQVDQFGSLLLHGVHTVLTGKSESERDVSNAKTVKRPLIYLVFFLYFVFSIFCSLPVTCRLANELTKRLVRNLPF